MVLNGLTVARRVTVKALLLSIVAVLLSAAFSAPAEAAGGFGPKYKIVATAKVGGEQPFAKLKVYRKADTGKLCAKVKKTNRYYFQNRGTVGWHHKFNGPANMVGLAPSCWNSRKDRAVQVTVTVRASAPGPGEEQKNYYASVNVIKDEGEGNKTG